MVRTISVVSNNSFYRKVTLSLSQSVAKVFYSCNSCNSWLNLPQRRKDAKSQSRKDVEFFHERHEGHERRTRNEETKKSLLVKSDQ